MAALHDGRGKLNGTRAWTARGGNPGLGEAGMAKSEKKKKGQVAVAWAEQKSLFGPLFFPFHGCFIRTQIDGTIESNTAADGIRQRNPGITRGQGGRASRQMETNIR